MVKLLPVLRVGFLAIVAAVSAANVAYNAGRVLPQRDGLPSATNPVLRQDQRFASTRRALGARKITGTIGYLCDLAADRVMADELGQEDYYLAQLSLAPIVLDINAGHCDWAVADFRGIPPETRLSGDWQIVEDSGDGVLLLRRAAR